MIIISIMTATWERDKRKSELLEFANCSIMIPFGAIIAQVITNCTFWKEANFKRSHTSDLRDVHELFIVILKRGACDVNYEDENWVFDKAKVSKSKQCSPIYENDFFVDFFNCPNFNTKYFRISKKAENFRNFDTEILWRKKHFSNFQLFYKLCNKAESEKKFRWTCGKTWYTSKFANSCCNRTRKKSSHRNHQRLYCYVNETAYCEFHEKWRKGISWLR